MIEINEEVNLTKITNSNRINTGLARLDELISGGLPKNSITLVSGTPGSGKTILCYHYLLEGLKNGENCLYLTSDERIDNIIKQANNIGFDFQQWLNNSKLKLKYLDLDKNKIHKELEQEIKTGNYTRVVIDSLTPITEVPVWVSGINEIMPSSDSTETKKYPADSLSTTRLHIRRIMSLLNQENCTTLITSEIPEGAKSLSRDTISEFLVDGIILMDLDVTMDRRKLTVRKMRATKHTLKPQNITITEGGIKFL